LANALNRIVQQEFEDFELIVCDNASTDLTPIICHEFALKDSRIRYFRNDTNVGIAANHNLTFERSRGRYFKWVAHDYDFPQRMLSGLVATMTDAPPSVSLVYSHCEYIDESGQPMWVDSDGVCNNSPWPHRRLSHFLRHVHMYNCAYGLIRSDVLRRTRLYGLFPGSDYVLFAELTMQGKFIEIPEPLLRIRRHSGRTYTANKDRKALRRLFLPDRPDQFLPISLRTQMVLELIRATVTAPLPARDKWLCTAVAIAKPQWETFRAFGGRQAERVLGRPWRSFRGGAHIPSYAPPLHGEAMRMALARPANSGERKGAEK